MSAPTAPRGMTPRDLAHLLRVSRDRVMTWIRDGTLQALDLGTPSSPRFIILPAALDDFTRRRLAGEPSRPKPRRRLRTVAVDYFPDLPGGEGRTA